MNSAHFENWCEKTVLPSFPVKGVIVIDKYHSRQTDELKNTNMQPEETASPKTALEKGNNLNRNKTVSAAKM